jgi:hypothetical protein
MGIIILVVMIGGGIKVTIGNVNIGNIRKDEQLK